MLSTPKGNWRCGVTGAQSRCPRLRQCQYYSGAASEGLAAGLAGFAEGSTGCDDGALRCCGAAPLGSELAWPGAGAACDGIALRWPKLGFCALQSVTSCASTFGKGLLARGGCGVFGGDAAVIPYPSGSGFTGRILAFSRAL